MTIGNELDGIMKFTRVQKWKPRFLEVVVEHLAPPCLDYDIEIEDLVGLIGRDGYSNLLSCAFDDFLTLSFAPHRHNPIDDYLKRNGLRESSATRAWLRGLRSSVMSLYEVDDIVPGQSFVARDLIRGGEAILVTEPEATHQLEPMERIAARIFPVGDTNHLAGGVLFFAPEPADVLLAGVAFTLEESGDDMLAEFAPIFSQTWLLDALSDALGPVPEHVTNSDGDEVLLHHIRYELAEGARAEDIVALIDGARKIERVEAESWRWVGPSWEEDPEPGSGENRHPEVRDDGMVVRAEISFDEGGLLATTNSVMRANDVMDWLDETLPGMLTQPVIETRTLDDLELSLSDDSGDGDALDADSPDRVKSVVHRMMDGQIRRMFDDSVAMLDDVTPRMAARSVEGREKLVAWLSLLESETARMHVPGVPISDYDFGWVWRELGVEDLRR